MTAGPARRAHGRHEALRGRRSPSMTRPSPSTRGTVHALVGRERGRQVHPGQDHRRGGHRPTRRARWWRGGPCALGSPRAAIEQGITTIAQELSLVPARSVVENVYLGIEDSTLGVVQRGSLEQRFARADRSTPASACPAHVRRAGAAAADQQKVEILRALARGARVHRHGRAHRTSELRARPPACTARCVELAASRHHHHLHLALPGRGPGPRRRGHRDARRAHHPDRAPEPQETHASLIEGMIGRSLDGALPARGPRRRGCARGAARRGPDAARRVPGRLPSSCAPARSS